MLSIIEHPTVVDIFFSTWLILTKEMEAWFKFATDTNPSRLGSRDDILLKESSDIFFLLS